MSRKPSSLDKEQAERLTERGGTLGQTATALDVLCCLDGCSLGNAERTTLSAKEIVAATGRQRGIVEGQIMRLIRMGYLEGVSGGYRLSRCLLGEEVIAGSLRHSCTAMRVRTEGDDGTSSTAS